MPALSFEEARRMVLDTVHATPTPESIALECADGRVLAEDLVADRDYPTLARSVRDGFAVVSSDGSSSRRVIGEVRAGESFSRVVKPDEAVEIMTGAPLPTGADSVIMVEHVTRDGDRISTERTVAAGDFVNPQGSEARRGDILLRAGCRLGFSEVALAATVGKARVSVYTKIRVAIIATGDEVVGVDESPHDFQIRNSNSYSIAAQVRRAGAVAEVLPVARDVYDSTRELIERGLEADLLLLAGGVSAGKYDIVEKVLADLGAEFYFDRVRIQPGQPLVFGRARGRYFFGLPGNPGSTMMTFELFARAAIERLSGVAEPALPLTWARLTTPYKHRTGLTRFLPATVDALGGLTPIHSKGSSDVPALARANAFLVAPEDRESWEAGEYIGVLLK